MPTFLRRTLLWSTAALAILLAAGFIGYAQLLSYLQGDEFRSVLQKELCNKAQASSVALEGTLGIDANRVSLEALDLWRPGLLQGITGRNIHAELKRSALLDRKLHLTRLMVEEGSLTLDLDRQNEDLPPIQRGKGHLLSRLAPTHAELERIDCKDFNATLRSGGQEYSLTDSALSANPTSAARHGASAGDWEIRLNNGRVRTHLPVIGESSLKAATLTMSSKLLSLSDARFMLSPGELIVNAVQERASNNWSADIRANSVDVSRLIGSDWKKRVNGMLYGRLRADGHAGELRQAEGRLSLQQGVLEALPFLENLPVGNSYPYRSLRLEKATARLSYPYADEARHIRKAWMLDQIDLRAEGGHLRVQGHALADADGSLGGTLLIGLPAHVVAGFAPAESPLLRSLFNAEGESGFLWLRLNLSGSLSDPQEDLSVRLRTLIGSALPDTASSLKELLLPRKESVPMPETAPAAESAPATEPPTPGSLLQGAGKAAGELIGSGLRSLF